jgi:hypothetical protein
MIVMGIDPGETTGWAVCEFMARGKLEVVSCGELNGEELISDGIDMTMPGAGNYSHHRAICMALMEILVAHDCSVVVVEDFVLRQFTTMDRAGIGPHGIINMLEVWLYDIMMPAGEWLGDVVYQTPSQAKGVMTDQRMKSLELWQRGLPHATDAVRHCEVFRRKTQGIGRTGK